jgi:hypothetical protein
MITRAGYEPVIQAWRFRPRGKLCRAYAGGSRNGAGVESWVVDLRPHGKRKYYPSRQEAETAARLPERNASAGKAL